MPNKYLIIDTFKNQLENELNNLLRDYDLRDHNELYHTKDYFLKFVTVNPVYVPHLADFSIMRIIK